MLDIILIVIVVMIGGYFAFRYLTLLYALKKITKEIHDIQQDLTQNQMLYLPVPNKHLKKLLSAFNSTLEEIQKERQTYDKREKEFKRQIENISHDLRTPLTVILGYIKLIKAPNHKAVCDKELVETMNIIESKAEIMNNLVTQFYDFARLNAGDYQLSMNYLDISRILRESLMGNYQILEQAHLQIETDIPEYPIWVLGEAAALERIFLNLFQNVGRYGETFLRISIKKDKENIVISFVNDTKALSEEDVSHLFDRFYMQNPSRNQGGTGLGLTVAQSLAREMGAELNAYILDEEPVNALQTGIFRICFELRHKPVDWFVPPK
ncbi:MAG: HAMP domain-containing sensor histidine kinase [Lachnospiraceae bacterium]